MVKKRKAKADFPVFSKDRSLCRQPSIHFHNTIVRERHFPLPDVAMVWLDHLVVCQHPYLHLKSLPLYTSLSSFFGIWTFSAEGRLAVSVPFFAFHFIPFVQFRGGIFTVWTMHMLARSTTHANRMEFTDAFSHTVLPFFCLLPIGVCRLLWKYT